MIGLPVSNLKNLFGIPVRPGALSAVGFQIAFFTSSRVTACGSSSGFGYRAVAISSKSARGGGGKRVLLSALTLPSKSVAFSPVPSFIAGNCGSSLGFPLLSLPHLASLHTPVGFNDALWTPSRNASALALRITYTFTCSASFSASSVYTWCPLSSFRSRRSRGARYRPWWTLFLLSWDAANGKQQ